MSRQVLTEWRRQGDTLTLVTKRDRANFPVAVVVILSIFGLLVTGGLILLLLIPASPFILWLLYVYTNRRTIRFDAELIQVENSFFNFHFDLARRFSHQAYVRKGVACPVSRILSYGNRYDNESKRNEIRYGYEIRIPYEGQGGRGAIITFPTEREMIDFELVFQRFWKEVPARMTWTENPPAKVFSNVKPVAALASAHPEADLAKDFTLDRGDGTIAHAVTHKEPNTQRSGASGPRPPMVTIIEKRGDVHGDWQLKMVSEQGGPWSVLLGRASYWAYFTVTTFTGLGGLALFVLFCYLHEPVTESVSDFVTSPFFQDAVLPVFVPPAEVESFQTGFRNFAASDPDARILACGAFVFVVFLIFPAFLIVLIFNLVRWPFWKRWTVVFRNTLWRPNVLAGRWSNDRGTVRRPRMSYTPFCAALAATPTTHRLLTGQPFFDRNPGWRAPLQVVIFTAEGSFPLPVANEEEQRHVIRTINEFTVLSTQQALARSHRVNASPTKDAARANSSFRSVGVTRSR